MADLSKLMKKRLGPPPPIEAASDNLQAPEIAPAAFEIKPREERQEDGRSARRTGRTLQFATRVSPDFNRRFRAVAKRDGLMFAELLEKALEAYEKQAISKVAAN
jgi:hypothetical protein